MDLRQIRYFIQVAESGSYNAAAARLRISQSSLSRRVSDLEAELGIRLLDRDAHGAQATAAGQEFLHRTKPLINELEIVREEFMADSDLPSGEVTVGTSPNFSRVMLGDVTEAVYADYPKLKLKFELGAQYALYEGIDAARIDLAVMNSPISLQNCIAEPLIEEPLKLVWAKGMMQSPVASLPASGNLPVSALKGLPLVTFPRPTGLRTTLDRATIAAGFNITIRYEIADVPAQLDFVQRGLCYAILSTSAIRHNRGDRELCAVPIEGLRFVGTLVMRAEKQKSAAVNAVANAIRDVLNSLAENRTEKIPLPDGS